MDQPFVRNTWPGISWRKQGSRRRLTCWQGQETSRRHTRHRKTGEQRRLVKPIDRRRVGAASWRAGHRDQCLAKNRRVLESMIVPENCKVVSDTEIIHTPGSVSQVPRPVTAVACQPWPTIRLQQLLLPRGRPPPVHRHQQVRLLPLQLRPLRELRDEEAWPQPPGLQQPGPRQEQLVLCAAHRRPHRPAPHRPREGGAPTQLSGRHDGCKVKGFQALKEFMVTQESSPHATYWDHSKVIQ